MESDLSLMKKAFLEFFRKLLPGITHSQKEIKEKWTNFRELLLDDTSTSETIYRFAKEIKQVPLAQDNTLEKRKNSDPNTQQLYKQIESQKEQIINKKRLNLEVDQYSIQKKQIQNNDISSSPVKRVSFYKNNQQEFQRQSLLGEIKQASKIFNKNTIKLNIIDDRTFSVSPKMQNETYNQFDELAQIAEAQLLESRNKLKNGQHILQDNKKQFYRRQRNLNMNLIRNEISDSKKENQQEQNKIKE